MIRVAELAHLQYQTDGTYNHPLLGGKGWDLVTEAAEYCKSHGV